MEAEEQEVQGRQVCFEDLCNFPVGETERRWEKVPGPACRGRLTLQEAGNKDERQNMNRHPAHVRKSEYSRIFPVCLAILQPLKVSRGGGAKAGLAEKRAERCTSLP